MTKSYRNPVLTVDIIIEYNKGIILIERKNPPYGWALPGGFVDYGETVEKAANREAKEETSLKLNCLKQFKVYSDPSRDPRGHTISLVFTAKGKGVLKAKSDARNAKVMPFKTAVKSKLELPGNIVFDHRKILGDYLKEKNNK